MMLDQYQQTKNLLVGKEFRESVMTETERQQARELHHHQVNGSVLNDAEQASVKWFLRVVSDEDAARRQACADQQDAHLASKEARIQKLAVLLQRQQQVAQSLRDALSQAEAERHEIARERQQIESAPL